MRQCSRHLFKCDDGEEKRLFPGIGAKCTILTRFMKPNGGLSKEKDHRSIVVLKEFFYEGHRLCFRFNLDGDDQQKIYHSDARYVRIDSEGGIDDFFFEADKKKRHDGDAIDKAEAIMSKKKEPAIKWKHSRARQLLYQDIMDNKVPLDPKDDLSLSLEDIFSMHAEAATRSNLSILSLLESKENLVLDQSDCGTSIGENFLAKGNDIWAITVDGVHCWIQETHQEFSKDTSYFSHKYNHAGLCYELGISIGSNRLVWMNGPFPAGKSDLKIFKEDGLKAMLIAKKKMCIADGGYAGSDHIHHCSTPNIHDSRPVRRFKARALKRHEKFNGLIKNFHSVDCRFRHSIGKFKSVFEAICVICQYQIETDKPLYHVLVEDVLLEDEVE
ncbi:DDE superfamily endonuclease [Nitzschia inconspicua]|uniref:DDE superfamily endonuclease n=1 Tax=Nitzschia inconspicua TaxID=303405 RepID=A0A9K3LPE8_9STRA|nr:DDE superfamily endonuclease [Nitzschia inconspicua]